MYRLSAFCAKFHKTSFAFKQETQEKDLFQANIEKKEMEKADVLENKVITKQLLVLPLNSEKYVTDTNICDTQAESSLLQKQVDKVSKSIGYWSSSLCDAKRGYDTPQKVCLAGL